MKIEMYNAIRFYDYPYVGGCSANEYLDDYNKQLEEMDVSYRAIAAKIMDFPDKYGELYCDIIFIIEEV